MRKPSMRIIHCVRAPIGGAFRHVVDLCRQQSKDGHDVGLLCDSQTGGETAARTLEDLSAHLSLGVHRLPIARSLHPRDAVTIFKAHALLKTLDPDVIHGHGAKGGVISRLVGSALKRSNPDLQRIYSPHGGSLHYKASSSVGFVYLNLERILTKMSDGFSFVCNFERERFDRKIGLGTVKSIIGYNGLHPSEFNDSPLDDNASDFLFLGEMRDLKGVDLLIGAIARLNSDRQTPVTVSLVGDGPDLERYQRLSEDLGQKDNITFHGRLPISSALPLGRIGVLPSRAESFPYVVLEMIAAGKPLLATNVGGIPEIYRDQSDSLLNPDSAEELFSAMKAA
ncbi:glycosyltransferase family 1 protein, partial [Rhodobacteraceae bacterium RKSG542]|uniref:glycosyltransferase n=1 Tax=Pseudovibrio flavus TaxID=2529854 RepID=UPI0012BC43CB